MTEIVNIHTKGRGLQTKKSSEDRFMVLSEKRTKEPRWGVRDGHTVIECSKHGKHGVHVVQKYTGKEPGEL